MWMLCDRRSAKLQHAGADGGVADAVDQDEAAGFAHLFVRVERDRPVHAQLAHRDLVQRELLRREMLQRVHIHLVLDVGDGGGDRARADLHQIGAAGHQGFVLHPHERRLELVGHFGRRLEGRNDVAALKCRPRPPAPA
jgi:hypothetical protein